MKVNTDKLIRINTYAEREGISVPAAHKRVKKGQVKTVVIDGTTFIRDDS